MHTNKDTATREQNSPLGPDIIAPLALAALVSRAPDQGLLLTFKLTLLCGMAAPALEGLKVEDFALSEDGDLRAVTIADGQSTTGPRYE